MAKKKIVDVIDQNIIRTFKKNRIFSRIESEDYRDVPTFEFFLGKIQSKIAELASDLGIVDRLYILDKIYDEGDINFLITTEDSYTFIINNDEVFNRLKLEQKELLPVPDNIKLVIYSEGDVIV